MKKLVGFFAIVLFLSIPLAANATKLGFGDLNVTASGPTSNGYFLDYDGTVVSSNFGYTTGPNEVFCVSGERGNDGNYDFYTITSDLGSLYDTLSKAAWIADNWTKWGTTDEVKGEAQKAVWGIVGVINILGSDGIDLDIYNEALKQTNYVTTGWYFAVSPSEGNGTDYQDYLTPVPEPTTMILLGLGLIGLAVIRKKL